MPYTLAVKALGTKVNAAQPSDQIKTNAPISGGFGAPPDNFAEASSINFRRSVKYGLGVLSTSLRYRLEKWGIARSAIFRPNGKRLACVENPEAYYNEATHECAPR
jgi:hypothetical protein